MGREAHHRQRNLTRLFVLGLVLLFAGGCGVLSGSARAPASVRDVTLAEPGGSPPRAVHVVRPRETLSAIAWRYGLDYRSVARWNRIAPPYVIFPGQRLALRGAGAPAARAPADRTDAGSGSGRKRAAPAAPVSVPVGGWTWPAKGRLIGGFGKGDRGGIAIAGQRGQPVVAARDGRVVYTGSGLVGYGRLVIIKHAGRLLTAYAHNDRILVKEGQTVRAGHQVAEMGSTGAERVKLHFEVRREGKPLNPLKFLPRRS